MPDDSLKKRAFRTTVILAIGVTLFLMTRDLLSGQPDIVGPAVICGVVASVVVDLVGFAVQRRRGAASHA